MAGGSTKAVLAAMAANGAVAVAKFVGFGLTGSTSLLDEHDLSASQREVEDPHH